MQSGCGLRNACRVYINQPCNAGMININQPSELEGLNGTEKFHSGLSRGISVCLFAPSFLGWQNGQQRATRVGGRRPLAPADICYANVARCAKTPLSYNRGEYTSRYHLVFVVKRDNLSKRLTSFLQDNGRIPAQPTGQKPLSVQLSG